MHEDFYKHAKEAISLNFEAMLVEYEVRFSFGAKNFEHETFVRWE